ncbi:hypothetical protein Pmani_032430 [Petrolisthes manimaculis]|uniref:Uncharacterized protein n=1 Tax=Petrolisthes manimaculis TaxID=1843537 RepID=A0AAE1NRP8_9EUCA|nr:hypothetical protein Pmani_032430 [Petrolisthes manimaculis]
MLSAVEDVISQRLPCQVARYPLPPCCPALATVSLYPVRQPYHGLPCLNSYSVSSLCQIDFPANLLYISRLLGTLYLPASLSMLCFTLPLSTPSRILPH